MMKLFSALLFLPLFCATAFITGMEKLPKPTSPEISKQYLLFILNEKKEIVEYGSRNMEFLYSPKEFLRKKITAAVPLSESDRTAIKDGLKLARHTNEERLVSYTLNETLFSAVIKYKAQKKQYHLMVTQD